MCGISGIIDQKPVTRTLVTSIANLEYRGYDSAGLACFENSRIERYRSVGRAVSYTHLTLPTKA